MQVSTGIASNWVWCQQVSKLVCSRLPPIIVLLPSSLFNPHPLALHFPPLPIPPSLQDVVVGKIYFLLVRIKLKHMEVEIRRRETTGGGHLGGGVMG